MTKEQLQALISSGENEQLEFKETTGQRGDACQALCAFLNADGGTVVFGVSRKGILTGQLVSDSTKRDLFEVFAKFEPSVAVATEWVRVDETHVAIVCHVDAGARKPYLYDGRPYRRLQSSTAVMPQSDYEAMLYDRPNLVKDWSSEVVPYATFDDLDDHAIQVAREGFIEKHSRRFSAAEVNGWDKKTFLDRARLTLNGCITRTTMLLVGKELSAHLLTPNPAEMLWKLEGEERASEVFYPPFLLSTSDLYSRIRNVQVRILPEGMLLPREVPKYKDQSVLEALHNCIAHQDYARNGRIVVTEYVDRLEFENLGAFYDGAPNDYVNGGRTPTRYRNAQLVAAMREVNMIDESGYGIRRLYEWQAERYFPMPDYVTGPDSVRLTIYGHVVDPAYSSLLIKRGADLRLDDICLLDRIQKKLPVSVENISHLRHEGLIEGRIPNIHISAKIAEMTGQEVEYVKAKRRTGGRLRSLIKDYLAQWKTADRQKINELLVDELGREMSTDDKMSKISNIIAVMRRNGEIENTGTDRKPIWKLTKTSGHEGRKSV